MAGLSEATVSLAGLTLLSSDFQPLSRALQCHTSLIEVKLSGNQSISIDQVAVSIKVVFLMQILKINISDWNLYNAAQLAC